jgi:hypothetical protein
MTGRWSGFIMFTGLSSLTCNAADHRFSFTR